MNEKKLLIIIGILTVVILFAGIYFLSTTTSTSQISTSDNVKAYVTDPTSYDWGIIPMDKGDVAKTFTIKNNGSDTLKLYNVKTSCHCTKAYVTINGIDSPKFGMDSLSSWTGEVSPGQEAKLTAVFDPAFHGPQGVGLINRFVLVETNDKSNQKLTFTLTGTVVKQ